MTALVEAACDYLARGLRILALSGKSPNGKVHPHWREDYISGAVESDEDMEFLQSVFGGQTTGIGILTGFPYVVVDIDTEAGAASWKALVGEDDYMSDRWVARTGRGGLHLWYAVMQPVPTFKPFGNEGGVDLKGEGGYVVAPPSLHPDTGVLYEWLLAPDARAPFEAPEPLVRRIEDHLYDLRSSLEAKNVRRRAWGPKWKSGDTVFYAQPGHDPLLAGMKTAAEGNRNNYLHWAAATMAEEGASDDLFDELGRIALEEGLDPVEVKRTIRSARRASE